MSKRKRRKARGSPKRVAIDRTPTDRAQEVVWKRFYGLAPTGHRGAEGLLAAVLEELTGEPFHVVQSGPQGGSDVRSDPGNVVGIGLESKQYDRNTRLPLDKLLHKLARASNAEAPVDVWLLATTRGVDATYREELKTSGERLGIDVIVWDWPEQPDALADLAVVCSAAPRACRRVLGSDAAVAQALTCIREHPDFERKAERWRQRLLAPGVGYASCRMACREWLKKAQSTVANAKSRLGGEHNLRSSEHEVIRRSGVNGQLDAWFEEDDAGIAALVGDEGMGKSWAALDWYDALRESDGVRAPLVVYLPARRVEAVDAKEAIATGVAQQVGGDPDFWRRRLTMWERCSGDGLRILVIVDGLNQRCLFRDWADWLQPLLEEGVRGLYRVLVTCWPNWWQEKLFGLRSLEPAPVEVVVPGFDDAELDAMLASMGTAREEFAASVLALMRVPRLTAAAMRHRQALADSGDVTAERLIYEDWKDRIRREGAATSLNDAQMKVFVAKLGQKLRTDLDRAVSRRNIGDILSQDSGKAGEELEAAVAHLTSGGWFVAGDRADTFRVEADRIAYVLGAALMAELKGVVDGNYGAMIAEFLDPLKAHSVGARILRAAMTIALVEEDTPEGLRRAVAERWLGEQNFGSEDFESLWRLAGLDAELFLEIGEADWLGGVADSDRDEVMVKTFANASAFETFDAVLKGKLAKWLGTVWARPLDGEPEGGAGGRDAKSRYRAWIESERSKAFQAVLSGEEGSWEWLGHRAVAVMSFLPRAPYIEALEAWCLSRAIMGRVWHSKDVAWLLRANTKDPAEASVALDGVICRLEKEGDAFCERAAAAARRALSHVGRSAAPALDMRSGKEELQGPAVRKDEGSGETLLETVRDYLAPDGWKRWPAREGATAIDALVEQGLPVGGEAVELLRRNLTNIVTIVSPRSRRLLAAAFDRELATEASGGKRVAGDLEGAALVMRLYDADARDQGGMILAAVDARLGPEWWPICRRVNAEDLEGLDFARAPATGLMLWLELVGRRLDKAVIRSLEVLGSLTKNDEGEVRRRAVELAAFGGHEEALVDFAASDYAAEVSDQSGEGHLADHARNRALVTLESLRPDYRVNVCLSAEGAALRVKIGIRDGEVADDSLTAFADYLESELEAARTAESWGEQRYWFSYQECVERLVERGTDRLAEWLRPWTSEDVGFGAQWVLMNAFPVVDAMRALRDTAPDVSLGVYRTLKAASKHGIVSAEGIEDLPFELPESEGSAACDEQLASVTTDQGLLGISYACHRHGRMPWLFGRIEALEASDHPGDVAKALTLLGMCDGSPEADAVWDEFVSRPPEDRWLADVFRDSQRDYERNRVARAAFVEFWDTEEESDARHAWKCVEENCDRRLFLWIKAMDPKPVEAPYARLLGRTLGTKGLNAAVRKDRDRRKKLLFHTPIVSSVMAPWGE